MVPRHYGIRTERYKLMHFYQFGNEWELYDLKTDPDELTNLYGKRQHTNLANQLKQQLVDLQKHYQENSDISEQPDEWKARMRAQN